MTASKNRRLLLSALSTLGTLAAALPVTAPALAAEAPWPRPV
jgi:hypothetical protein